LDASWVVITLQVHFAEMSINQPQTGVDDSPEIPTELFDNERSRIASTLLSQAADGSPAAAQEFSKRGCPLSWRSVIWRRILGVRVDDIDVMYYDQLKVHVLQHELLVDSLVYKDIKLTATNDDQYFVFEDYLYQVACYNLLHCLADACCRISPPCSQDVALFNNLFL